MMDSQNDSQVVTFFFSCQKQTRKSQYGDSMIVPTKLAQEEQSKQQLKVADAEISELRSSLRYVEIQLAKNKEEKDQQNARVLDSQIELEKCQENLAKQIRYGQQLQKTNDELTKKIDSFNDNQNDLVERGRFKANGYMNEINARDKEIERMRNIVNTNSNEMKMLTVSREQFRQQKEVLEDKVRDRDTELLKMKTKVQEQQKLIENLCIAQKNQSLGGQINDQIKEDIEKVERISKSLNRSGFMNLGDKQPKTHNSQANKYNDQKCNADESYISDDSIPAEIFNIVQSFRDKMISSNNKSNSVLLIDDFFAQVHRILKDQHMREIARIRNEHSVEIMKLRKTLESQLNGRPQKKTLSSKENHQTYQSQDKFVENEIEKQRRQLIDENEMLKKKLRAVETIMHSNSNDRSKFMEGASWIAKKSHIEIEKHINQLQCVVGEFQRKVKDCVVDQSIAEVNGREVLKLNTWIIQNLEKETSQVGEKFESMFENVNFHLRDATKEFYKKE